jgi:hypothetical protein
MRHARRRETDRWWRILSYPAISTMDIAANLDELLAGAVDDLSHLAKWVGGGDEIDLSGVESCIDAIRHELDVRRAGDGGGLDDDQFEGAMAARLHRQLLGIDQAVLDDPGFWAYLATGPLWFFTRWREEPEKRKTETYRVYVDGRKNDACVPLRMFLRAQAVRDGGDYGLVDDMERGTDFWRSHVLRVKTGSKPELARAVVQEQVTNRMTVNPVREYAKRINRRWSNQVIHLLDEADCKAIAASERPAVND